MKLLTANLLDCGSVVWFSSKGWVRDAKCAVRLKDEDADAALKDAQTRTTTLIGAYLIPLSSEDAPVQREGVREFVRANGPTIGPTQFEISQGLGRDPLFKV
jgi:hypothetical protein